MLAKTVDLQRAKDNPGTSLPSSDFVLLASLPDDHLLDVASDSGLALVSGVGSSVELLSLVRAKEIAQAALAQAQVTLAEQKAAADAELAVAAQCGDPGPSVVQSPGPIGSKPLSLSLIPVLCNRRITLRFLLSLPALNLPSFRSRFALDRCVKLRLDKHESHSGFPNESVHLEHPWVWAQRSPKAAERFP
jgi:hypothetical protein